LEESTGRVIEARTIEGVEIRNLLATEDGRLLASADVWEKCLGKSDAVVLEVMTDLSVRTLFRYGGPLAKRSGDLVELPDGRLILVGSIDVQFDLDPYVKPDLSDVKAFWPGFTGELFANDRKTVSAFVVLLDRAGHFLADRVMRDLRGRVIRPAAARPDGSLLFGGLANGVSSWFGVIDTN
jgi:hypothetical protein